jgi:membrane fusion protein, multidrug efflux system
MRTKAMFTLGAILVTTACSALAAGVAMGQADDGSATATVVTEDLTRSISASGSLRAATTWTISHQADPDLVTTTVPAAAGTNGGGSNQPAGAQVSTTVTQEVPSTTRVTALPVVGTVVSTGSVLYATDDQPSVLIPGSTAAWRTLKVGVDDGPDIAQVEAFLAGAGYDTGIVDEHYDAATAAAVKAWQEAIGRDVTGAVELGSIVFAPTALTVESVSTAVGATVSDGDAVLVVRSADLVVDVAVGTDLAPYLSVGDEVSVRLPDRSSVPATVRSVVEDPERGRVAIATLAETPSLSVTPVPVTLTRTITVANGALVVPVSSVVHLEGGVDAVRLGDGTLVRVVLGATAGSNVAVTSADLADGDVIDVP